MRILKSDCVQYSSDNNSHIVIPLIYHRVRFLKDDVVKSFILTLHEDIRVLKAVNYPELAFLQDCIGLFLYKNLG